MDNIFQYAIDKVSKGACFHVSFARKTLKVDGKVVINNGKYDGCLGIELSTNPLSEIEELYAVYRHSIPSERSCSKRKLYFSALNFEEISDEDMLFGVERETARVELELFVLCQMLLGALKWDDFAKGKWFWQSSVHPTLILLKSWTNNN